MEANERESRNPGQKLLKGLRGDSLPRKVSQPQRFENKKSGTPEMARKELS